jgi:D-3-phosphoglycerate dehydrogenase
MAKFKVVISDYYYESLEQEKREMETAGAELLDYHCKTEDEVIEAAQGCDALICQFAPITRRVIETLTNCKIIVRYAIGVDNIDVQSATEHGIYVANVPDYGIDEVSNHAVALLLDCAKRLTYLAGQVKKGNCSYTVVKPLYRMQGRTLGLVGFGRIPRLVARKMAGFGMNLLTYDPYINTAAAQALKVVPVSFEELLTRSDYISVHCPLTDDTRHMFDRAAFEKMKNTAVFVNTARGAVASDDALVWALENGQIAAAGVDVTEEEPIRPDHPLLKLDNAVVTPHTAWYSEEAVKSLQLKAAQEVARVLRGETPKNPVNKPIPKR